MALQLNLPVVRICSASTYVRMVSRLKAPVKMQWLWRNRGPARRTSANTEMHRGDYRVGV
ncbi:hypothetical protein TNCV_3079251, partial [Trichonephila clavipes]